MATTSAARPTGSFTVRQTKVLLAVVHLHRMLPPVTTAKVDRYLDSIHRRDVERTVVQLADAGLVEIGPGRRNRVLTPTVQLVPHWPFGEWEQETWVPTSELPRRRFSNRLHGSCTHLLTSRFGRLCIDCGEVVDAVRDTGVSSTS